MSKENLKYVWLAIFVIMVGTVITCQGASNDKSSSIIIKEKEKPKEVEAVEPIIEEVQEVVEPKVEEVPAEEPPIKEILIETIPPVDTLERKEFYDENNWKYDDTVPQEEENGQD